MRWMVLGVKCKANEWRRAERWGLCWNACATRCTFSGVRTVRRRPGGFLLTMDAVVLNCVTQFNIVWRVRTFPFLPMSKCHKKTRFITLAESLFLKNVSTANALCPSDQRCMMTEGFKPLYPAMCVSPHHLQRCRDGAKCKSSNCFCPTLYMTVPDWPPCRRKQQAPTNRWYSEPIHMAPYPRQQAQCFIAQCTSTTRISQCWRQATGYIKYS